MDVSQRACSEHPHFPVAIHLLNRTWNRVDFVMSMRKYFIGPMPVRNFLDKFLPVRPPSIRKSKLLGFEVMAGLNLESQVDTFVRFISAIPAYHPNPIALIVLHIDSGREFGTQRDQSVQHTPGSSLLRLRKRLEVQTKNRILRRKHEQSKEPSGFVSEDGNVCRVQTRRPFRSLPQ